MEQCWSWRCEVYHGITGLSPPNVRAPSFRLPPRFATISFARLTGTAAFQAARATELAAAGKSRPWSVPTRSDDRAGASEARHRFSARGQAQRGPASPKPPSLKIP